MADVEKIPDGFQLKSCFMSKIHLAHTWTYKRHGGLFWCPGIQPKKKRSN